MAEFKLTYFDTKGVAEPIRLLFAMAQVPYEDVRIPVTSTDPSELVIPSEIKNKLPYGQVPVLEFGTTILSQSRTIGRFLAHKFDLMGSSDLECAKINEIVDALKDYAHGFRPLRMAKNDEDKKEAFKNIQQTMTPRYIGKFNEMLKNNGGQYLVGQRVSWADLAVFYVVTYMHETFGYDAAKEYSELKQFVENIANIPQIKLYIQNRPKTVR